MNDIHIFQNPTDDENLKKKKIKKNKKTEETVFSSECNCNFFPICKTYLAAIFSTYLQKYVRTFQKFLINDVERDE